MKQYVAGFLFNRDTFQVALIKKNRPDWQKDRFNAIGGRIEEGETAAQAMVREFKEETGCDIRNWEQFATLVCEAERHPGAPGQGEPYQVHFFRAFTNQHIDLIVKSLTDEQVCVVDYDFDLKAGAYSILPNLNWLIPMALHIDADAAERFHITEIY